MASESPGTPADRLVTDVLSAVAKLGDRPAVITQRGLRAEQWTGTQVAETAWRVARELEARGLEKGGRVILWAGNGPEWIAAFHACILRGLIVVPLDRDSTGDFVERVAEQTQPLLVLTTDALTALIQAAATQSAEPYPSMELEATDTAEIIFTSGATGTPKGVVLTHANIMANVLPFIGAFRKYRFGLRCVRPLRLMSLPPLSHVFGQYTGLFLPALARCAVVFVDTANPSEIISAAKRHRAAAIAAVPRMLQTLRSKIERDFETRGEGDRFRADQVQSDGWSPLRRLWHFRAVHRRFGFRCVGLVSGGATLDRSTENFWSRLGFAVLQGYGMTETAALVSVNVPFRIGRGSIGEVLPGQEVRVDETGEILVRGANVTPGYWGQLGEHRDDGWLHTGDVGEIDAEGRLWFSGRKKDVIVTSAGLKVYPDDLEEALARQPGVRSTAVVGVDGAAGPEPVAALVLDPRVDPSAIVASANAGLAEYQRIRRWMIWPDSDFPRTPTQKIIKPLVAEFLRGGAPRRQSHDSELAEIVSRIGGEGARLAPEARLADDLKLDSLGMVELLSAIEDRYQVDLDESAFSATTTVADVDRMIQTGLSPAHQYPYPRWTLAAPVAAARAVFQALVIVPLSAWMSLLRIRGREHLDAIDGPVLFVSNHLTWLDPGILLPALPFRFRRRLAIAMMGEQLRAWRYPSTESPWLVRAWGRTKYILAVTLMDVFPLPQQSGFRRSFAYAGEAVDRGFSLLVFPEGARTPDGAMHTFQAGTGLLAIALGIPVVPLRIDGLHELKTRRRVPAPGSISIAIGPPAYFRQTADPAAVAAELARRVEAAPAEPSQ